jgi:hypothetical protein
MSLNTHYLIGIYLVFTCCTAQKQNPTRKSPISSEKHTHVKPKTKAVAKPKPKVVVKPEPKVVIKPKPKVVVKKPLECLVALKKSGAKFRLWQPKKRKIRWSGTACTVVKGVILKKGATGLDFQYSKVNCEFALSLIKFEKILQEEAKKAFGEEVKTILNWGTYQCRNIGKERDFPSEHSFGNALDIKGFILKSRKRTTVLKHFIKVNSTKKATKYSKFWDSLGKRLYKEGVFSTVLTPNFDKVHYNHFHFDGAEFYSVDGT